MRVHRIKLCVSLQPFPPLEWPHQHHKQRKPILQYMCIENHPLAEASTQLQFIHSRHSHTLCVTPCKMHVCECDTAAPSIMLRGATPPKILC